MSRRVSASIDIDADPATVFDVLVDPEQHPLFDGSGTVKGRVAGPPRLYLGASFAMRMFWGAPYVIRNRVVEYDEDKRVAWRHIMRHIWRYELEPVGRPGSPGRPVTRVTETFDYAPAPLARLYDALGWPERNRKSIESTLQHLKVLVESRAVIAS